MTIITALLITLGALLASFGVAGFAAVWAAPDHDSLRVAQAAATTGRRLLAPGLALYVAQHHAADGPVLALLLCAAALTVATYATRTSHTIIPNAA